MTTIREYIVNKLTEYKEFRTKQREQAYNDLRYRYVYAGIKNIKSNYSQMTDLMRRITVDKEPVLPFKTLIQRNPSSTRELTYSDLTNIINNYYILHVNQHREVHSRYDTAQQHMNDRLNNIPFVQLDITEFKLVSKYARRILNSDDPIYTAHEEYQRFGYEHYYNNDEYKPVPLDECIKAMFTWRPGPDVHEIGNVPYCVIGINEDSYKCKILTYETDLYAYLALGYAPPVKIIAKTDKCNDPLAMFRKIIAYRSRI